ncbi:MAG: hypothetical protein K6B14_06550 [Lachnospiraceae bacterium]|nr:hypothetical protein [Lachnospiraceae bacterium]
MHIFNWLTGMAAEACILTLCTYLARPKNTDDESEYKTWNTTFMVFFSVAFVLLLADMFYTSIQFHRYGGLM